MRIVKSTPSGHQTAQVTSERSNILSAHLAEPHIDIDSHVRKRLLQAGRDLAQRKKIYLDTNFWVALRRASNDRSGDGLRLLDALLAGKAEGWLVCPLSEANFIELFNQSDPTTRMATARIMAELSDGYALLDPEARMATEVMHWFRRTFGGNVYDLDGLIWTKAAFVFGVAHPFPPTGLSPPDILCTLQKSVFDDLWAKSLVEMVDALAGCAIGRGNDYEILASKLNAGNRAHAAELRSFAQAYRDEAIGAATMFPGVATAALAGFARQQGVVIPDGEAGTAALASVGAQALAFVLTKKRDDTSLRSLHVHAALHASARWNRAQKLDAHDLLDFQHAAAALAYCNAFLTDNPMRVMIEQKHLNLGTRLGCRVASSIGEALELVEELRASSA
jgi:hypothetical protein